MSVFHKGPPLEVAQQLVFQTLLKLFADAGTRAGTLFLKQDPNGHYYVDYHDPHGKVFSGIGAFYGRRIGRTNLSIDPDWFYQDTGSAAWQVFDPNSTNEILRAFMNLYGDLCR